MSLDDPVVITCSISGTIANRDQCPAIPYTPKEYAAEARRIVDDGGVMIHIHARRPDGTPSYLRELRPEVAALNMGSMNYAKYSRRRKDFVFKTVFANPFDEIIEFLSVMRDCGIKPEHECFDLGHVGSLPPLVDMGVLQPPLHVSCVMGVVGGVPPGARNLAHMVENVPAGSHWGVIGVSRDQWMLVAAALTLGGSVRVGLEDNFYLPDGEMARSNGDLIARARRMTEDVGRRPATVAEARELMAVRPPERLSRRETLAHPIRASQGSGA
jgi:3-keto-5-aminohexanoate cleavage enzyme